MNMIVSLKMLHIFFGFVTAVMYMMETAREPAIQCYYNIKVT